MALEIWKDVIGYETLYKVSNLGNIKSFHSSSNRPALERNVQPSIVKGYARILLTKDKQRKGFYVHRLVAIAFIPNPENKLEVNHIDGNKLNNCIDNVEWVTAKENSCHAVNTGLRISPTGQTHGAAKLTSANVLEAKQLRLTGVKFTTLATKYNVSATAISSAVNGKTWKSLTEVVD